MNGEDMRYKPSDLKDLLEYAGYSVPDHITMSTIKVEYPDGNIGGDMQVQPFEAKKEGILLDPVYSGKGFAGLIGLIKNGKFTKKDNILFIHTGGAVSLSAYEWAF